MHEKLFKEYIRYLNRVISLLKKIVLYHEILKYKHKLQNNIKY